MGGGVAKKIVCRCEDVTIDDILEAIERGARDLETLKRMLRIGMGPCQGSHCIPIAASILARKLGVPVEEVLPPGYRPPLTPTPIKYFLKGGGESDQG
ncbi:MAG: (2Fe-2S)-binding protein [Desulfurococcales archaeon]|nr:(2Fe-2S)-binding protein [Desulfurococcales archaeon]